jgi:hypothetical protein
MLTFWPYVWQLDPGHTYDEHQVLALKTGCDTHGAHATVSGTARLPEHAGHAVSASGARPAPAPRAASAVGLGRQTVAQSAGCAWQGAEPCPIAAGRIRPMHCLSLFFSFSFK